MIAILNYTRHAKRQNASLKKSLQCYKTVNAKCHSAFVLWHFCANEADCFLKHLGTAQWFMLYFLCIYDFLFFT